MNALFSMRNPGSFRFHHLFVASLCFVGATGLVLSSRANLQTASGDPKLTLEIRAMPLEKAAQELAQVIGKPITVSARIKNYTTLVKVKDVPFSELREKFTTVFGVYWEKQKDGAWFIGKTAAQHKAEEDEEIRERTDRIKVGLEKLRVEVNRQPFTDREARNLARQLEGLKNTRGENQSGWQAIQKIDSQGPGHRLAAKMISLFTPESLASIPEGKSIVFCNRPTRMQKQLPFNSQPLLDAFAQEQNTWASAAKTYNFATEFKPGIPYIPLGHLGQHTSAMESPPAIVMAKISLPEGAQNINVQVVIGGQNQKILQTLYFFKSLVEERPQASKDPGAVSQKLKVALSPDSEAYATFLGFEKMGERAGWKINARTPTPEQLTLFLDPVRHDPISFIPTDALFQVAKSSSKNMIAHVTEVSLRVLNPDQLPQILSDQNSHVAEIKDDRWHLIGIKNRPGESRKYCDRLKLRTAIRVVVGGLQTIESDATIAALVPMFSNANQKPAAKLPYFIRSKIDPNGEHFTRNQPESLEFYGLLSPTEQAQARTKSGIFISGLNQAAVACLSDFLFYSEHSGNFISLDFDRQLRNEIVSQYHNTLSKEPTWAFPDGLPKDATIQIVDRDETVLYTTPSPDSLIEFSISSLARMKVRESRPDLQSRNGDLPKYDTSKLMVLQRRKVQITIRLNSYLVSNLTLSESKPRDGKVYTLETLPDNLKKQYQEAYEQAKKGIIVPGN